MAKSIILEWDPSNVRVALGASSAASPALSRLVTFPMDNGDESDEVVTIAESLAAGLDEHKVGRGDATVIVERAAAELRVLVVPPVPEDEFPSVVNFQANREFSSLAEGWLLDYIRLPGLPNGQSRVLAGAISPQVAAQIRGGCEKAGLSLKKVILRPFAVARLLTAANMVAESSILAELLSDSLELSVFNDGELQLTRSVRISPESSPAAISKQIQMEIRRTLTAFRNQQHDSDVKRILLMAPEASRDSLSEEIADKLSMQCLAIDPLTLFGNIGSSKEKSVANSESYAAVLGGLCKPAEDQQEIDFVNPTKPPAPPSNKRRNILIGATVATLLVSLGGLYWMQHSMLSSKVKSLRAEIVELNAQDKKYQARMAEIDMLDEWIVHRVNWLEELGTVSQEFPLPDDAIVDNLGLSIDQKRNQAVMKMTGRVASTETIRQLEQRLRNPELGRQISGKGNSPTANGPYKFRFDETLTIDLVRPEGEDVADAISGTVTDTTNDLETDETAAGDEESSDGDAGAGIVEDEGESSDQGVDSQDTAVETEDETADDESDNPEETPAQENGEPGESENVDADSGSDESGNDDEGVTESEDDEAARDEAEEQSDE